MPISLMPMSEPRVVWQVCRGALEENHKGFPAIPVSKSALWGPNLNASMQMNRAWGINRRGWRPVLTCRSVILLASQMWWDGYYDWNVRMGGHWPFGKDRQERWSSHALYVNSQLERIELLLDMEENQTESLWARIKGRAGNSDIIEGCFTGCPAGEIEKMKPLQMEQPHKTSSSWDSPISVGGTAQQSTGKQRGSWHTLLTSFFWLSSNGKSLDHVFITREWLVATVKLRGSWGCSDNEVVETDVLRAVRIVHSKIATLLQKKQTSASLGIFLVY